MNVLICTTFRFQWETAIETVMRMKEQTTHSEGPDSRLVVYIVSAVCASAHPSVLMTGSLFFSSSLSSALSVLKPLSWAPLNSGLNTSSSLRLTKQAVWYQRSIRPSWGFSGSTDFLETRIWSWEEVGWRRCEATQSDLKIFLDEKKNGCKPFLSSARSLYMCCGLIWRIPLQIHSVFFLLWRLPSRHSFLFRRNTHWGGERAGGSIYTFCEWNVGRLTSSSNWSTTFDGLLHLLLVVPAEVREAANVAGGLGCSSLPEAGEVVPVGDLAIKHGGLWERHNAVKKLPKNDPTRKHLKAKLPTLENPIWWLGRRTLKGNICPSILSFGAAQHC